MASVNTFTEVAMIDTRNNAGTITLPLTTTIPFRTLTFKDIYGNFSRRTFTLNTQGSDLFEDGVATKTFSNDFAFIQVYAGGNNRWYILDGTTTTSQIMSSLVVSSITGDGSALRALPAISTASLQSTIQGLGTYAYVSTASLQSTLQGLGTAGFISSSQLFSTVAGIGSGFTGSTNALSAGTVTAGLVSTLRINTSSIQASNGNFSSIVTNSIQIGTGLGWLQLPPLQVTAVSSINSYANQAYINSTMLGGASSQTSIQFFGLNGSYQNSVIAERSTGTTSQELILFKGSSTSDQIRLQTTGNFLIETGVAARTFPNMGQVTTPTIYANTSGQVGIGTSNPSGFTLNVAGTGFFQTSISTPTLYAGTIYYSVAFI